MRPITSADITRLSLQYDIAVCAEISARHHGNHKAWQKTRDDQDHLSQMIAWLKQEMEKQDEATADLAV